MMWLSPVNRQQVPTPGPVPVKVVPAPVTRFPTTPRLRRAMRPWYRPVSVGRRLVKITREMVDAHQPNLLDELYKRQVKLVDQDEWCMIYTGRFWQDDLSEEFARHAALMCD